MQPNQYDIFDFYFYGTKGLAVFKNIGRDIEIYDILDSSEHDGFTELNNIPKEKRGGKPRDQFGYLAKNVIESLKYSNSFFVNTNDLTSNKSSSSFSASWSQF